MKVRSLGHVVIKVRDQQRAEDFHNGLLGISIAARYANMSATFFALGNHHDFAVVAVGDDAEDPPEKSPGLLHIAFLKSVTESTNCAKQESNSRMPV